jgi:hypothetical protein
VSSPSSVCSPSSSPRRESRAILVRVNPELEQGGLTHLGSGCSRFVGSTATDYGFYWEAAAELIAAGILSLLTLVPLWVFCRHSAAPLSLFRPKELTICASSLDSHFFVHRRGVVSVLSSLMVEVAVVAVIWLLYLGRSSLSHRIFPFSSLSRAKPWLTSDSLLYRIEADPRFIHTTGGAAAFVAALPNLTSSFCDLSLCKTAQALQVS